MGETSSARVAAAASAIDSDGAAPSSTTSVCGARMVVGATKQDIRTQFLIEAAVLCLLGSLAGIAFGVVASAIIAGYSGWPVLIRPGVVLLAVVAASATGLFFGLYPARKAARTDDIHKALG